MVEWCATFPKGLRLGRNVNFNLKRLFFNWISLFNEFIVQPMSIFKDTKAFRLLLSSNQVKFDVRTHDESETTLQGYDTVGCSRLLHCWCFTVHEFWFLLRRAVKISAVAAADISAGSTARCLFFGGDGAGWFRLASAAPFSGWGVYRMLTHMYNTVS